MYYIIPCDEFYEADKKQCMLFSFFFPVLSIERNPKVTVQWSFISLQFHFV